MPVISRDEIKEGYVNTYGIKHAELPLHTNGLVTDIFFSIVNQYLAGNVSIVVEAAFQHNVWEPRMPEILELASSWIVLCSADDGVVARRHLERGLENPKWEFYHGDKRVASDSYIAPHFKVPTIRVSTNEEYVPSIDEIVKQIRAS